VELGAEARLARCSQPTCENIGTVMSQRPVGGSYAGRNTSVSITIGKLPTRPCLLPRAAAR
jgi:hypothetical protein